MFLLYGNLPELYKRLTKTLKSITQRYEIIFINDGSTDNTESLIRKIRRNDKKVKAVSFSRNFGHMAAVNAGLQVARGQRVVLMDADLQDPPELITQMYRQSLRGSQVVYAVKEHRKEGPLRRFLFSLFYRLLNQISSYKMPLDAGTFSLMTKDVVKILNRMPERNKYFSGLRAWVGFKQSGITYKRGIRAHGKPASFRRLFSLALSGFLSFSYLPLRIASFLGFFFAGVAFVFILIVILLRIFFQIGIVGWASTMSAILLIGGVQLITLGILGEYLARIYDEVKQRPEYLISEKIGFKNK